MQERFEIGIIHKEELTETKIREANNRLSPLGVSLVPEPSGSGTYLLTVREMCIRDRSGRSAVCADPFNLPKEYKG